MKNRWWALPTVISEEQRKEIEEQQHQVKVAAIQWVNQLDLITSVDLGEMSCGDEGKVEITIHGIMKD